MLIRKERLRRIVLLLIERYFLLLIGMSKKKFANLIYILLPEGKNTPKISKILCQSLVIFGQILINILNFFWLTFIVCNLDQEIFKSYAKRNCDYIYIAKLFIR